ncbi:hypothetical protein HIM_09585 [Hirsutella minnesotensis 3608]|uniref:Uncharacterized protein n=1 Tax=Hirsutella minnesotensis 3608 TaxID=1043627 RepID=A0A0F8A312_9HYPO|nr:hypothetical protein HIM_09585 [Hirsutella minnesotensis 3608]
MKTSIALATLLAGIVSAGVLRTGATGATECGGGGYPGGGKKEVHCKPGERREPNVWNPSGPDVCIPEGAVQ